MPISFRRVTVAAVTAAMAMSVVPPASAQSLPDLPVAPAGAVGQILDPLEDLLGQITDPLGDALGDIPFDNAVRLLGEDAIDAAVALSRITFETSDIVLLGRDDVFADTLSSVSSQGIAGAPLLLTQTDGLDARVVEELGRLGARQIIILGSTQAISESLEAELAATYGDGNVSRVGGPSRIETSAMLADFVAPTADRAVLMRAYPSEGADQSQAYVDALSVGPLASTQELPSLLTTTEYLHPSAREYLGNGSITRVTIVGGESAVSPEVEQELIDMGLTVDRIAGVNRWDTSIQVARAMGFDDAADASRLILTEGGAVTDPLWSAGFAAAAQGAVFQAPILLADGPLLPPETLAFLGDGLISNALRLSNLPVICNSFVSFLACETAALLLVGPLDEVNQLTGGALEQVLGPVFQPLSDALTGIIPGAGEAGPGLIGQILAIIGVQGDPEEAQGGLCNDGIDNDEDGEIDEADECESNPEAAFQAAMLTQPVTVQDAFTRMIGAEGNRVSTSRQAVLIDILGNVEQAIGRPVDTANPLEAAALVTVLDSISSTLATESTTLPLEAVNSLLVAVESMVGTVRDTDALGDVVADMGIDTLPATVQLTDTVAGLLGSNRPAAGQSLVMTYGAQARDLANTVDRLNS